ncbi:MAG: hypothetical protein D6715_02500, partial [Calditrichaeota bacterium]
MILQPLAICRFPIIVYLVFFSTVLSPPLLSAQWSEAGAPEIRNVRPADYQGGGLNYAIAQDSLGLIYVANESGVLVYDGVQWELIRLPDNGAAHSLCYA